MPAPEKNRSWHSPSEVGLVAEGNTVTFPDEAQAEAANKKRGQETAEAAAVVEGTAEVRIDNQPLLVFKSLRIAEAGISKY